MMWQPRKKGSHSAHLGGCRHLTHLPVLLRIIIALSQDALAYIVFLVTLSHARTQLLILGG